MGEVIQLHTIGTYRARFLIEEWRRLLVEHGGDHEKATKAHLSLCRDWGQIWGVDTDNTDAADARLRQLSDAELLAEWRGCVANTLECDLIAGEMERRGLDH